MGVTAKYASMLISRTMHLAGIDESAHALRHSMATDVMRAGASCVTCRRRSAANLKTTERYLPLVVDDLRTAMAGGTYRNANRCGQS